MPQDARRPRTAAAAHAPARRLAEAVRRWGAAAYLAVACGVLGCATLGGDQGQSLVPSRAPTRTGPFAVYSPQPLPADAPAVRCLQSLERDVAATLGVRASTAEPPVEVYILRDREAFTHFLTFYYPELPPRRAFFIAQGPRRVVYTFQNDRLAEDLRHEATHALLHATVGDLPLWLDEGLAEYFEGPGPRAGLNPEHLARLPDDLKAGWKPDLVRLESLASVRDMSPRDYRESWAWVHFLLNEPGPGKPALLAYLSDLERSDGRAVAPLSERLGSLDQAPGRQMLAHLERVRTAPPASNAPPAAPVATQRPRDEPTILLQSNPLDPAPSSRTNAPRRGFWHRLFGAMGVGRP